MRYQLQKQTTSAWQGPFLFRRAFDMNPFFRPCGSSVHPIELSKNLHPALLNMIVHMQENPPRTLARRISSCSTCRRKDASAETHKLGRSALVRDSLPADYDNGSFLSYRTKRGRVVLYPELLHLVEQRLIIDIQQGRGLLAVPSGRTQRS